MTKVQIHHNLTSQLSTHTPLTFYRHTPLRSLEAVTVDVLKFEEESEGLTKELINN